MGDCMQWKERRARKDTEAEKSSAPKPPHSHGSCCPLMSLRMLCSCLGSAGLLAQQGMALSPQICLLVLYFKVDHATIRRRVYVSRSSEQQLPIAMLRTPG